MCVITGKMKDRWFSLFLSFVLILASGSGCSRQARIERHLSRADKYFGAAQYESAIVEYRVALKLESVNQRAIVGIGSSHYAQNKLEDAFPFLGRAVELSPTNTAIRLKLATIYLLAGENEQARKHASFILKEQPSNFDALKLWVSGANTPEQVDEAFRRLQSVESSIQDKSRLEILRGRLYMHRSDWVSAEQAFKTAQNLDPNSRDAHMILGDLYAASGRTNLAGREFEKATEVAPTNAYAWFEWAEFKRKTGELAESKKLLSTMVERNPEYASAWYRLAQINASEGNFKDALEQLESALKREPKFFEALALKARIAMAQGNRSMARDQLERLVAKFPQFGEFHYLLANVYAEAKEPVKALDEARKAAEVNPADTAAALLLAELRIRTGDAKSAVSPLENLITRRPSLVRAHVLLGSAYLVTHDAAKAVATYRTVTELIPNSDRAYYLFGLSSLIQSNSVTAAEAFEKALSLNPRGFEALERLIALRLSARDYEGALARVNQQMLVVPDSFPLHLLVGKIWTMQKNYDQAEVVYRKAIDLAPDQQSGYQMLSQVQVAAGRVKTAVETLEKALAKKPDDLATLSLAGSIFQNHAKDPTKARTVYEKILAIQPESANVLNNLAALYLENSDGKEKAFELASKAYKLAPENPAIQDTLAWCSYHRGDYKRALALLTTCVTAVPKEPELTYHLGMTQCMLGQEAVGRATLQRAISLSTNFSGVEMARQMYLLVGIDPSDVTEKDMALINAVLRVEPASSPAIFRAALVAEKQSSTDAARKSLETLIENNPAYFPAVIHLAEIYSERDEDHEKALKLARKAVELAPGNASLMARIAPIALRKGDNVAAIDYLGRAARSADSADLQYKVAKFYYEFGKVDSARSAARLALQMNPSFPLAAECKAFAESIEAGSMEGNEQKVLEQTAGALAAHPGLLPARMVLAAVHQKRSESDKARAVYEEILKEKPYCVPALKELLLIRSVGLPSASVYELALRARKLAPQDPMVARALAKQAYGRKEYRMADTLLRESNGRLPETAESLYYTGLCRYHLNDKSSAKQTMKRAIRLDPKLASAAEVSMVMSGLD